MTPRLQPHIVCVIRSLSAGGAERILTWIANALAARGYRVCIVTFDEAPKEPFFPLRAGVELRSIGGDGISRNSVEAIIRLARKVGRLSYFLHERRPDIVLSFMDATNVIAAICGRLVRIGVVISERTDPLMQSLPAIWKALRRICYPLATLVICPTTTIAGRFPWLRNSRRRVIANPVAPVARAHPPGSRPPTVVCVGRLYVAEKGQDLLLEAFAGVLQAVPTARLRLVGDGPDAVRLHEQAERLGLDAAVEFVGQVRDVHMELVHADVFVLPSRLEAFPNALAEAMAAGLPSVSFRCPAGPVDLITHGHDGLLVDYLDAGAMGAALTELLLDPARAARMGDCARSGIARFTPAAALARWEGALRHCMRRRWVRVPKRRTGRTRNPPCAA